MDLTRVLNIIGIPALMLIAWLISTNRKVINWRVIGWGLILELIVALIVFVIPIGTQLFLVVNDVVNNVLESANYGTYFVFGKLAIGPGTVSASGETSIGFILAFQGLAVIIFFAALVGILYYTGIMGKVMKAFSYIFSKLMGISGAESLSSASSIFVGVEAGLVIKPYINKMTRSELNTILTVGMSTIASSMLAVYIMILKGSFPNIAGHLVSASIMNVPAAIIMSKILCPETDTPETIDQKAVMNYEKEGSLFEAIINNANSGVKLAVGIVTLLLAVLGLMALSDKILVFAGSYINHLLSINIDWTLKGLLGYLFYPLTLLIGIPVNDAWQASKIIGERLILTEVTAFQDLAIQLNSASPMSPRAAVMVTYALTGFAHVASIAIFVGGYIALAPSRIKELSSLSFRALLGATLACLLTATIAGLFFTNNSILLGQ
ncbi:nucleoside transporter [bacterium BRH_c32]|nr:MAG: nucleoside transporter [bacterium BRH_c32]